MNDTDTKIIALRKQILHFTGPVPSNTHPKLNKNSGVFLHCILTSIQFNNDKIKFNPSEENKKILDTFTQYDLVDTYERLSIMPEFYPKDYVIISKRYVEKKVNRLTNNYNQANLRKRRNGCNKTI